jgi:hypothetical protein
MIHAGYRMHAGNEKSTHDGSFGHPPIDEDLEPSTSADNIEEADKRHSSEMILFDHREDGWSAIQLFLHP